MMKHSIRLLIFIQLFILRESVYSQVNTTTGTIQQMESLAEQSEQSVDLSEMEESKNQLLEHPLDLNHSTKDELIRSGLVDEPKAEALLNHIHRCGVLIRLEELQSIDGFDELFIRSILPFITIKDALFNPKLSPTYLIKNGSQQITTRIERIIELQDGYKLNENGISSYVGSPWKICNKYKFSSGPYFSLGITAEKDPGENFFSGNKSKGFDFYSMHVSIRPGKIIRNIILGDYQVQFGQGLVAWSGLAFGKSSEVMAIKKQGSGIRPYSSSNEYSFLRGIATSIQTGKVCITIWESIRNHDANLIIEDTLLSESGISSIGMAGYHRTSSEIANKNILQQFISGGNIKFSQHSFSLEVTVEYTRFSNPFLKGKDLYEIYKPEGNSFYNAGVSYNRTFRNYYFFGETATDKNGNPATLNGVLMSISKNVSFSLLHRNYSKKYFSINGNPFREGSQVMNECGTYSGMQILITRNIKFAAYLDFFSFPWLRYRVDAPASGNEWLVKLTYTPSRTTEVYIQIKAQNKPADDPLHYHVIDQQENFQKLNFRFNATYKISSSIELHNRVEWTTYKPGILPAQSGSLLMQEIQYKPMGKSWSITAAWISFNTESYDSRIYAYEQGIPGSSSIPPYYYDGSKWYVLSRVRLNRKLDIWLRIERTTYSDRETIGSGNEAIQSRHKTETGFQCRYRF